MQTYMIERRYGRCNRDWLAAYGPGDQSTTWTLGTRRSEIFTNIEAAKRMLHNVRCAAENWENGHHFTFAVIEDRRHLPSYFGSTTVE